MYFLAIDLGASSGRHILGRIENGKLVLEEIHRFKNSIIKKDGHLCWDTPTLFEEILIGLEKCKSAGKIPQSIGIDSWGVDFTLLDKEGNPLGDSVSYRDGRTEGMQEKASEQIFDTDMYVRTGTQSHSYNTVYQLLAIKYNNPELLEKASGFLLTPEYFTYLLTGVAKHEHTIASTTGLVNAYTQDWDFDLISALGLPENIFGNITMPGTVVGSLLPKIQERIGFDCKVIFPCTHDTGSAVVAAPLLNEETLFLSSGTWSLLGAELSAPITKIRSHHAGLTNEAGYNNTVRYLKNIMGLGVIHSIKAELNDQYTFWQLSRMAQGHGHFHSRVDMNDPLFMAPDSMIGAVKSACAETNQPIPQSIGETMHCVYQSLAMSYAQTAESLEEFTGKSFSQICIVGGGSQDEYLNRLTAKACNKTVTAGPVECTAIGNIIVQMISQGVLQNTNEARQLVCDSFSLQSYI